MIQSERRIVFGLMAGHGGLVNGVYQTAGKQHRFPDGKIIYEGVLNRKIKDTIMKMNVFYPELCIIDLVPEQTDVSLSERARRCQNLNRAYKEQEKDLFVIEIHCNAFNSLAHGYEVFTSVGQTFSDRFATLWFNEMMKQVPELRPRPDHSDGDPDKEKDFYILRENEKAKVFGVLLEFGFFDNRKELDFLESSEGGTAIAKATMNAMLKLVKGF